MTSLVYWLFLASGAAGLIYEVVWMRMLMRMLGATVLAYTIVLTAFMLGLALGGWHFGRRIDRRGRPLLVYAALESGIAVWALILPAGLNLAIVWFSATARGLAGAELITHLVRIALAFAALLLPTVLMGGTLPVLSKFLVSRASDLGPRLGALYAVNTSGAILGAGAAGFLLIGRIGEIRTTLVAIVLNLTAAAGAVLLARTLPSVAPSAEPDVQTSDVPVADDSLSHDSPSRRLDLLVLGVVAVTGFTILAYEVLWTRLGVLLLSNTTYSFSLMLLAFLTGIAVGSAVMAAALRAWRPSWSARARIFAGLQIAIGVVALVTLAAPVPVVRYTLPLWTRLGGPLAEFIAGPVPAIFLLLAPLTLLSGASFPLGAALYAREARRVGTGVGAVYLWNTIGAAAGSAVAGFALLPWLGISGSFLFCIGLNLVAGSLLFLMLPAPDRAARLRPVFIGAAIALVVFSFSYRFTGRLDVARTLLYKRIQRAQRQAIFYQEDINGIVSVWINPWNRDPWSNDKRLYIDAQAMAVAYRYGMIYERLQAHYPLLLHPDPQDVLVICLGTGTTLGSVGQYPVSTIDCVELSRSIVAAGRYFTEENHSILEDPRVTVHIQDGRNYLLTTPRMYDVITAEPMHPHLAGTVNLYTKEYFELVKSRLRPGGVCSHWIPLHRMLPREIKQSVEAFREVFPHTMLFVETSEAIILGSDEPLVIDAERWRSYLGDPRISQDLREVGLASLPQLLSTYIMDDDALEGYVGNTPPVTDDLPTLEFFGPAVALEVGLEENIRELVDHRDPVDKVLRTSVKDGLTEDEAAELRRLYPIESAYLLAYADYAGGDFAAALEGFEEVLALAPDDRRAELSAQAIARHVPATERTLDPTGAGSLN
ncbi:MAG: fused MFS/spermidine synthase [Armatimonadetes bacterium]|nr:fused MFS/spermidine synthase [Armatimonadota bacterium]